MIESLGRMQPLRLTKSQWGMVSGLKTSGGTWSTYLGELRRLGFIDEGPAGFTLTDAGFDFEYATLWDAVLNEITKVESQVPAAGSERAKGTVVSAVPWNRMTGTVIRAIA